MELGLPLIIACSTVWCGDIDGGRDDLRDYVTGAFGDADAVLVVDETGDLKRGASHRPRY